jgi:hypothetical protein
MSAENEKKPGQELEVSNGNPFGAVGQPISPPSVGGNFMTAEMQRSIAEVQAQFIMAMHRPRNPVQAYDRMMGECQRKKLAEVAMYSFARGGTKISGLSIRALEMVARNWGNIRYGFRVLDRSHGRSSVQAYAIDLENNIPVERIFEVKHWRDTTKGGYALKDERDIYELEANQAQRRVRACLEALIPGDVLDAVEDEIKITLTANADLTPEGIKKMLTAFEKVGVNKAMIEARIQRKVAAIEASQKVFMSSILNSIKDGMSDAAEWFDMSLADKAGKRSEGPALKEAAEAKKASKKGEKPEAAKSAPKKSEEKQDDGENDARETIIEKDEKPEETPFQRIKREIEEASDADDLYNIWTKDVKEEYEAIKKADPQTGAHLFEIYQLKSKTFEEA